MHEGHIVYIVQHLSPTGYRNVLIDILQDCKFFFLFFDKFKELSNYNLRYD